MRLATLKDGSRDGRLVVVSRDLARAAPASPIAATLREAVEHWDALAPHLEALYDDLNADRVAAARAFDPREAAAPLPRASGWLDASAFLSHGVLMTRALGLAANAQRDATPLMYQGGADDFLGPHDPADFPSEADGIDFEGEFGVVLGEVALGATPEEGAAAVRLVVQVNDWSLRNLAKAEMASGFGFLHSKPATAFAPVAVTPDELGPAWTDGRVRLPLEVWRDGELFGRPSGAAMAYSFGELIAHAARTRRLRAGTILGSGTVSNDDAETVGSACISERRALDALAGRPPTAFMRYGERVRMEARAADGSPMFGAIDQSVTASA